MGRDERRAALARITLHRGKRCGIADDAGIVDAGIIDVLYHHGDVWAIADFKTDEIRRADQVADRIAEGKYDEQLRRYADAVAAQLGVHPRTMLVFLNVARQVVQIT